MREKRIAVCTGSRADYGLLEPLIKALDREFHVDIIATGSHVSDRFGKTFHDIDKSLLSKVILSPMLLDFDNSIGVVKSMGIGLLSYPELLTNLGANLVIVLGDRYEVLAFTIAAYTLQIPVVHIEGDDVTFGSLDQGYRECIKALSSEHLTVEEYGSLGCVFPEIQKDIPEELKDKYIVVYHPYKGNWKEEIEEIVEVFKHLPSLFIGSNADAGGNEINKYYENCGIDYIKSLPRNIYLSILYHAKAIVGNSSSGIIEAPELEIPTINIGNRQLGRKQAASIINCTADKKNIEAALKTAETINCHEVDNPYRKSNTVQKMVDKIRQL